MSKKYVLIKNTKEKLEVVEVIGNNTIIKNTKGQNYKVPNNYLITSEEYEAIKIIKKNKKKKL